MLSFGEKSSPPMLFLLILSPLYGFLSNSFSGFFLFVAFFSLFPQKW